jgi:homoserine acetyltransferase
MKINYKTIVISLSDFQINDGRKLVSPLACYTIYGDLNNNKKTALFFHGFSSSSELHTWLK